MSSIEGQQGATAAALSELTYEDYCKQNPLPVMAAAAGSAVVGAGVGLGKKGVAKGMEVTREVAPVVAEEAVDMARRAGSKGLALTKGFGKWLRGNPATAEEKATAVIVDLTAAQDYEWETREFVEFDGTWVYYRVAHDGKHAVIKVAYDPTIDWDFEEEMPKENPPAVQVQSVEAKGGIEMTEEKVEAQQTKNPPVAAAPTLYTGVTDPNFLPVQEVKANPPTDVVKQNPPAESLDTLTAEWDGAGTPDGKKAVKKRVFLRAMKILRAAKKSKDTVERASGMKLLNWVQAHRVPKATPNPPVQNPPVTTAAAPVVVPEVVVTPAPEVKPVEAVKPAEPVAANPAPTVGNPTPSAIINPPVEAAPAIPVEAPKIEAPKVCQHKLIYMGVGNPVKGGAPKKVFRCTECEKTFAKEV